jgi:hypothetical protein
MGQYEGKAQEPGPPPLPAETKDVRFAGTFQVLVPCLSATGRRRSPLQFPTLSAEGKLDAQPRGKE